MDLDHFISSESESSKHKYTINISIIGKKSVGKTSLINRYISGKFTDRHLSTVGLDYYVCNKHIRDKEFKLQIWDCSLFKDYKSLANISSNNKQIIFALYDITNKKSFDEMDVYIKEIKKTNNNIPIIIVASKCDLTSDIQILNYEGNNYAKKNSFQFYEISCKDNYNISELFFSAVLTSLETIKQEIL